MRKFKKRTDKETKKSKEIFILQIATTVILVAILIINVIKLFR